MDGRRLVVCTLHKMWVWQTFMGQHGGTVSGPRVPELVYLLKVCWEPSTGTSLRATSNGVM